MTGPLKPPIRPPVQGIRFLQENAIGLALMAVAGFSIMYVADPGDLDNKKLRDEFLENIRMLRADLPRARAFVILEALNELHPDPEQRALLQHLVNEMRSKT